MRTTLTLDDDVAMLLKKQVRESGRTFKDVVNHVLRRGLIEEPRSGPAQIAQPRPMGGSRVDLTQALSLAEGLDDLATDLGQRRDRP